MVQFSVQSTQLSDGYAALNADDWPTVEALFCQDIPFATDPTKTEFPAWYPMKGGDAIRGRQLIFEHLKGLRADSTDKSGQVVPGVKATLLGVIDHGNTSITLDFTTGGTEGAHACADKVEFDESGLIKVFWHCAANTHKHGHAGHPEGHLHPPSS